MKRVTLEVNYQDVWREIFRPNSDKVEVLEAIRALKCDRDGFAIICRIRLRDKGMAIGDLMRGGSLRYIETLYEGEDGSQIVYIQGKLLDQRGRRKAPNFNLVTTGPPEFVDTDTMRITFVGNAADAQRFLHYAKERKLPYRILALASLKPSTESILSRLTEKQRRALLAAYGLGYYDVPRRISSEELGRRLNVDKSTLVEHLRKAEKRLLSAVLPGR